MTESLGKIGDIFFDEIVLLLLGVSLIVKHHIHDKHDLVHVVRNPCDVEESSSNEVLTMRQHLLIDTSVNDEELVGYIFNNGTYIGELPWSE